MTVSDAVPSVQNDNTNKEIKNKKEEWVLCNRKGLGLAVKIK